jgi:type I restriction enzyme S subunit
MKLSLINLADVLKSADVFVDGDWVESKDQDVNGDVRLVQLADVGDGYYINKSSRFLTSDKARELRCTFLEKGDILLARMPEPLGRACIFPSDPKKSVTVVDVCIIRLKPETHDPLWLMHCLNAPVCRNQIADFATGTTRTRISRGNLAKIKIPLSPLADQKRIAEILDRTQSLISKRKEAIAKLDTLTQSIFLEMFGDPATNPKGWDKKFIKDIGQVITGIAVFK